MSSYIDTIISKGKGKIRAIQARFDGVVGVFKTLIEQHGELEALLDRVQRDADKRQELWPKIHKKLRCHERVEIEEVYPALRRRDQEPMRTLADQHDADAGMFRQLVAQLNTLEITSDAWGAVFQQFAESFVAHAVEEETEVFPLAQSVLGEPWARRLDGELLATKKLFLGAI